MEALTGILEMVKQILAYFQEGDAAAVIEIVKNALANFQEGDAAAVIETVKNALASIFGNIAL